MCLMRATIFWNPKGAHHRVEIDDHVVDVDKADYCWGKDHKIFSFAWDQNEHVCGYRPSGGTFVIQRNDAEPAVLSIAMDKIPFFTWRLRPVRGVEIGTFRLPSSEGVLISAVLLGMFPIDFKIVRHDGRRLCYWKHTTWGFGDQKVEVVISQKASTESLPYILGFALCTVSTLNGSDDAN